MTRWTYVSMAVAFSCFVPACTTEGAPAEYPVSSSSVSPALDVRNVRVLEESVNMMEPLELGVVDGAVSITFASRGHETTRLVVDPSSLETRSRASFVHEEHPPYKFPPCTVGRKRAAQVVLGGVPIEAWSTFDARVVAARPTGDALPISPPEWSVVGRPQAVAIDERRAVVAFFAGNDERYRVVAVAIETAPL